MPPEAGEEARRRAKPYGVHENRQAQGDDEGRDGQFGAQSPEAQTHKQHRRHAKLEASDAQLAYSVADGDYGEEEEEGGLEEGLEHTQNRVKEP